MDSRKKTKKTGTKTSSFGAPGRINHDSTQFYSSRLYEGMNIDKKIKYIENQIPVQFLDKLLCKSSEKMDELPDDSVHLMITSPPYIVTKECDRELSLPEYLALLDNVWKEIYRVLVPGGRACIDIPIIDRKPYIPLHIYIIEGMQNLGFLMRGEIIWNKASSSSSLTPEDNCLSAADPVLQEVHEYILVFSKDSYSRKGKEKMNTISKKDFLECTKSVWTFPAFFATKIDHPAPFPEELPHRLIQLYSYKDDVVLDPFVGSGTTCLSAIKNNRHFVGYDINADYISMAERIISAYMSQTTLFE